MSPSGSTTPESKVQDFNRNLPEKDGPFPNTMRWFYGNERGDTDRRFGDETYLNEDPIFFRDRDHLELDNSAKDLYKFATKETDPEKKEAAVQRLRRYEMWRQGRNEKPYEYINKEKRKDHVKTFDRGNGLNYSKMFQAGPDHAHEHMTDEKRKAWSNAFYGQDNATDQKRQALLSGLISEWSQIPVDQVDKNYDAYLQAFMDEIGVQGKVDDAKAFTESSRWLKRRTEQAQNRNAVVERTQEIIDRSIINGLGSKETLDAATDELLNEFGEDAIDKATLTQAVQRSWTAKVRQYAPYIQDARSIYETAKSSIDDSKSRSKDSSIESRLRSVASLNREDRHNLLYLIYKMAEQDAGEHEGGFGSKVGKSFLRGVYDYVDNQLDALEIVGNVEIESGDKSVKDWQKNKTTYERSLREFRQDLRGIRDIVRRIESDNGAIQGIYDAATSVPYTLAAAAPYGGGIVLNALAMSTQNDMELRTKYPDMNPDLRWKMASGGGAIQSLIERAAFRAVIKPFPKLQGAFNKIGIRGTAGTLASRIGGGFAIEYGEEAFQEITVPVIQDIAGIFNEEIPDVTAEEWEHHTRIFRGDSRTAWAVLPLAVIMGGGSTAIDRIGAGKAREFLGRADAIWLAGVTQEEAKAISTTKDPLKAQKMLLSAVEAKTDEELNDNKKQAVDDGAENRLIEQYVEEHGTKEEKANLRAEKALTNFENKFYPSVKQSEDGRYEVRYPELHNKPSEFFDTEAEAGAARDAILEDMGEQDIREMELSEANIKAMQLAKDSLEESHEGAEIKISKKADITLEKAVEEGLATIEQLMERVNIYAVSEGKANTMTWDEAKKKFTLPGQVMLKQKVRGYVARLTRGAGVQTIYEEGAEGYIREMMQNETVTEDFLTFHLRQYEQDTGEQLFQYKDKQSSQEVVEAFSKLAQAHVWNSRGDERMNPKLGALIDLLRQFFKAVLKTAENLLSLKKQGLLDQEFEKHLDRAVGLDEEQILENQRREHEREMLEEMADPDTEIQIMMKGQLMRPSDMEKGDLMYGEVKDLYDHFRKESKSKKTKDGKSRVSSAGSSVLFAKKGEGVELDLLREKLNEQGFEFDTPADMLEALDMSMRGMRQFPTIDPLARQQGEQGRTFSIGRAAVTHNKESQHFQTKDGGLIGPASFSIKAWHGTPHKVEKFSTENIGTGEGAQAYGWGLYFAEEKTVATAYQRALSNRTIQDLLYDGKPIEEVFTVVDKGIEGVVLTSLYQHTGKMGDFRKKYENQAKSKLKKIREVNQKRLEFIDTIDLNKVQHRGSLYTVELNVEQDELLDWDKPLSEQSEKVRNVLAGEVVETLPSIWNIKYPDGKLSSPYTSENAAIKGQNLNKVGQDVYGSYANGSSQDISESLSAAGIKGIKYLDGNSRGNRSVEWKGDKSNYGELTEGIVQNYLDSSNGNVDLAIRKLKDSPPEQYQDAARALESGDIVPTPSYNYVIFNDKDITITAENGEVTQASTKRKNHSGQEYDSSSFSIGRADRMGYYSNHGAELSKVQENEEGDLFAWRRGNESYKGDSGRNSSNQSAYRGLQEKFARWAKKPDMAKAEAQELIKELNEGDSVDMWLRDMFTHDKAWSPIGKSITNAEDAFAAFSSMRNPFIESLRMLVLDGSDKVIHSEILTVGSLDQSIAAPRDFLRVLAAANSEGTSYNRVVIAHNHPGGDPSPSRADVMITKRVKDALELVDAKLVDHIITNGTKGYSFESQDTFEVNKSQDIKWSVSERVDAQTINDNSIVMRAAQVLRAANPKNNYAILLSTRLNVMGLVVLPARPAAAAKTLLNSASNTGASAVVLAPSKSQDWTYRKKIASALDTAQIRFLDSIEWSKHNNKWESAQTLGLMEDKSSFSITPAQDATYMQAIESGDVEAQQEMVDKAAKAAGYAIEAYHVTNEKFDRFDPSKAAMGGTFWFTENRAKIDNDETGAGLRPNKEKIVLDVYLKANNSAGWDEYDALGLGEIEGRGFDSVKLDDDYIIFNSNQIKSADPVTYDADGNVIPLSKRFDESRDEITFSLGQVEDPVITKLQSLMRDPDTRVAFYKVAQRRLERVRTEIATREIKAMMSEQGGDDRIAIMDGIAQLQALASALPVQIRAKLGGEKRIASYKTTRGVNNYLKNRLDKIDNLLEKHIREEYIERIDKLIEKATPKKGNAKVAKGKITPEGHVELDEIVKVIEMSSAEVADAVNTAELDLSRAESIEDTEEREDAILKANAAIGRLSTFGNLKNKKDPISAQGSQEAHAEIDYLVTEGRSRYMLHLVAQKEHRQDLKRRALEVITGGRGRKLRSERLKEGENNQKKSWLKQEHARNVSFEMMLNGLSRMDKGSATLDSWLNQYFGQAVHKATHGEAIAANRKKLELLRVVAAVYELDTESVGWQGTVEDVMNTMSERHADSGIFIEEQAGKQVLKSYRAEVEAIASGEIDVVHSGYGWVRLSKREIEQFKALLEADNAKKKGQPKKNFEITRKTDGVVTEQYMSQDSAMFLTMMWKQIGLRPAMEAHGYNAEVMKQFEKFLTRESKLLRTWMFRQYDLNHDYFNTTFKKMFGVNLVKVKNYSPAKSVHGGRQVKDMIDASHGKQSTTPGMAMERIQHQAEPRYDVGAIQAYLQHVDATEHFVHWAEPVAELRSVFMDRDVRESILDHHGPETYAELIERIDMFADGGNMMAKTNRFADHLRKTFTVAKLAFNWGVFLKQLTSLPAYGFDMPVKDFLKYEAEFFSDMKGNWKKMWSLPYTQNRFDAGYDRDVMAVINSISKRKGKFAKAAEWGMVSGRAGDIIPVIVGGYTAYRYHFEKAKSEGKSDAQAEVIAVLQFEMSTDRAQQSGNIKDQSSYGLGGSLFRIFTMFQTSPRQYYSNMMEAILDAQAGRKGGGKRAAKAAFIAHVVLPSLFYWMSAGTRNLFRGDDDRDDLDELLKGWVKSMALGPFSGVFLWGQIGQEMASGYEYSMPVFEFGKESMDASSKLGRMWKAEFDDDDATQIEAKDVIGFLDNIARTGSLLTGKGATWYDIGTRASKSVGFTKDRVERIMMGEVDSIVLDLGEIQSEIYEEKLPDKDEFPNEREEAKQIRYEKLAEEYSKTKAENPSLWPEIADKLKAKNKLPEAVEDLMD